EPERNPEVLREILLRALFQTMVFPGAPLGPLMIQILEHEGHPANTALDQSDLEVLVLVQKAGAHEIAHRRADAQRMQHRGDRQLSRKLEIVPNGRTGIEG